MSVVKQLHNPKNNPVVTSPIIGVLEGITEENVPLVSFKGSRGHLKAKSALNQGDCEDINSFPVNVLIVFDENDASKPVVSALIRDTLYPIGEKSPSREQRTQKNFEANIDGKTVSLTARDEIKLACGKSSILLRKDGKVIIKGANLVSRSSASNKIKGGNVSIN